MKGVVTVRKRYPLSKTVSIIIAALLLTTPLSACKKQPASNESSTGSLSSDGTGSLEGTESLDSSSLPEDSSGTEASSGSTSQTSSKGGTTANTSSTRKPDQVVSTQKNLKGRVIKIRLIDENRKKDFTDKDGIYYPFVQETQTRYNCKFEFQVMSAVDLEAAVTAQSLSRTADFDVAQVSGYNVAPRRALSGEYVCLSDYCDFEKDTTWGKAPSTMGSYKGKYYALPIGIDPVMGIFYNKSMVKAANQPDPWTYVEKNQWNFDTFKKFAKALTVDKDGDGIPEQFGFVSEEPFAQFILANNGKVIDLSGSSGASYVGDSAQAKAAVEYVLSLYKEKIIPTTDEIVSQNLGSDFLAMANKKCAMFPYGTAYASYLIDKCGFKPSNLGWIYFPKGPSATDYISPASSTQDCFMVLRYTKDPGDVIVALADAMAFWSDTHKSKKTVEQWNSAMMNSDEYLEFFSDKNHKDGYNYLSKNRFRCHYMYNYDGAKNQIKAMWSDILTGKHTIASGMQAYGSAIKAEIKTAES